MIKLKKWIAYSAAERINEIAPIGCAQTAQWIRRDNRRILVDLETEKEIKLSDLSKFTAFHTFAPSKRSRKDDRFKQNQTRFSSGCNRVKIDVSGTYYAFGPAEACDANDLLAVVEAFENFTYSHDALNNSWTFQWSAFTDSITDVFDELFKEDWPQLQQAQANFLVLRIDYVAQCDLCTLCIDVAPPKIEC